MFRIPRNIEYHHPQSLADVFDSLSASYSCSMAEPILAACTTGSIGWTGDQVDSADLELDAMFGIAQERHCGVAAYEFQLVGFARTTAMALRY
ncbi:hypothetical protein C8J55DRAFT_560988 [Lentinula edodes]|uniref:Uncharacterized protein n=1 Tax=Lentinula lateritia TaxID=40482 RepID=A0A9W9DNU4_9AGAR|nr:hypothetical protein C8J55DRAFT_560988 [Lentinula edodes]